MSRLYEAQLAADISIEEAGQALLFARQFYALTKAYIDELIRKQSRTS